MKIIKNKILCFNKEEIICMMALKDITCHALTHCIGHFIKKASKNPKIFPPKIFEALIESTVSSSFVLSIAFKGGKIPIEKAGLVFTRLNNLGKAMRDAWCFLHKENIYEGFGEHLSSLKCFSPKLLDDFEKLLEQTQNLYLKTKSH